MNLLASAHSAASALLHALPAPEAFPTPEAGEVARRLRERLGRDLLPQLDASAPLLLVAVAGPNNVGKSTLFNTLTGADLSPARAEGGLTRQCLAAVHPGVWSPALLAALATRYEVVPVEEGGSAPVDQEGPPGRLYLVRAPRLPERLLLMDTPDFDSVFRTNRLATEALLVTVDVVLFVVSRQTYQNAALVDFLRTTVGAGRPYVLVYNEATSEAAAQGHLDTLAGQVGHPPVARYAARHQPAVEAGAPLSTTPLEDAPPLFALLGEEARAEGLKRRALAAAVADAAAEAQGLAASLEGASHGPERLRGRLRHELQAVGEKAALRAVPADVVLNAFRDALDAQSPLHRALRLPFRALTSALSLAGRGLRRAFTGPPEPTPPVHQAVDEALRDGVRALVERLSPEVAAWQGDARTRELLAQTLGPRTLHALEAPLPQPAAADAQADEERFHAFCQRLLAERLPRGAAGNLLQSMATLVYSAPAGAAAAISVATGGMGHDVAVWVGSLLTAPLLERFVDVLGADLRQQVVEAWAHERGATLAHGLEAGLFGPLLHHLDAQVAEGRRAAAELRQGAEALRRATAGGLS